MKKLKKLYNLYLQQSNYQVAGNEWSKPLAFHTLLSQILRRPNPETINATMPMTYLRAGKEISIREHLFVCQGARCLKYDTLVQTQNGVKRIEDLNDIEDLVLSWDFGKNEKSYQRCQKIDTGVQKTFKIKLDNGDDIVATTNHTFFVKKGNKIIEKKLKELIIGDKLVRVD